MMHDASIDSFNSFPAVRSIITPSATKEFLGFRRHRGLVIGSNRHFEGKKRHSPGKESEKNGRKGKEIGQVTGILDLN